MRLSTGQSAIIVALLFVYFILFYLVFTHQYRLDFSSLYSACLALSAGENPYQVLLTTYLSTVKKLPVNLNPPIVLWLINPLSRFHYDTAVVVWSGVSFILGLIGAGIAFQATFSRLFLRKNGLNLLFIYLSAFCVLMDTAIAQLGSLVLFLLMFGYHLYIRNKDISAGIIWGIVIALKFFPALLFIYVLIQKRYRVFISLLTVFVGMGLIPLLVYGPVIYTQYFSMLSRVAWYGDSWNASIYGFIFRLFVDIQDKTQSLLFVKSLYVVLLGLFLGWTISIIRRDTKNKANHPAFCMTLVMMLLLSPLGWLYYFPLLIFPLSITWKVAAYEKNKSSKAIMTWLICLFLINFPMDYITAYKMPSFIGKLGYFSFHFYGLLLLAYMTSKVKIYHDEEKKIAEAAYYFFPIYVVIFSYGLLVLVISFGMRWFSNIL